MIKTLLKNKKFRFNLIAMSLVLLEMYLFQTYAPYMLFISILLSVITGAIGIALKVNLTNTKDYPFLGKFYKSTAMPFLLVNGSIYLLYSFYKWSKKPIKINETEVDFSKRMLRKKRDKSLKNLLG